MATPTPAPASPPPAAPTPAPVALPSPTNPGVAAPAPPVKVLTATSHRPGLSAPMVEHFNKIAALGDPKVETPPAKTPPAAPDAAPTDPPPAPPKEDSPGSEPAPAAAPAEPPKTPAEPAKPSEPTKPGQRKNAWEVADTWKQKALDLERQLSETAAKVTDPVKMTALEKRAADAEARAKQFEEQIRYVDYTKSPEFEERYAKPEQEAWALALEDLKQLEVRAVDAAGQETTRPANAQDLVMLANMPLGKMVATLKEAFGDAAPIVLSHLTKVRDLAKAKEKALADATKVATQRHEEATRAQQALESEVRSYWQEADREATEEHDFLRPADGDDEWNGRLSKAQEFVEKAHSDAAALAKLTPEQRRDVVRRHAAMRNRAIAYPMLRLRTERLQAQVEALNAELAKYKASTPPAGGEPPPPAANPLLRQPVYADDLMKSHQAKLAELAQSRH